MVLNFFKVLPSTFITGASISGVNLYHECLHKYDKHFSEGFHYFLQGKKSGTKGCESARLNAKLKTEAAAKVCGGKMNEIKSGFQNDAI